MRASPCQHSTSRVDLIFSCEAIQSRAVLTKLRPRVGPTCSLALFRAYGLVDISRDVIFLGSAVHKHTMVGQENGRTLS